MIGKLVSEQNEPRFLLDESLAPVVAQALKLVGYDGLDVPTAVGQKGAKDPEIIDWCRQNEAVWVHADDRAKKQHKALLQTSGIRTVWIYRKRGAMSGKEQLRILTFILPLLIQRLRQSPGVRHYRVSASTPLAKPTLKAITL